MQPGSLEHLTYCEQQAEHCRIATSNESLTVMDRVGAQVGELDWMTAAEMEKENSLAELAEDLAAIRESQNKSAEEALSNKQGWNEVCPSCHIHRGHRANCPNANTVHIVPEDLSLAAYREFLQRKVRLSEDFGFSIDESEIHPSLKPHQKAAVAWAVKGGRRALFESFGLGKTRQQLEIIRLILRYAGGRGLIVAPLGVRQEFEKEAAALGIQIRFIRSLEEAGTDGIYITNYETVRDGKLDPANFTVASLDEAAILRGFGGVKTFREFMRLFEAVPYRFVATATPSPNEYIELLAYSAFLGIMEVSQAKTRFFKRDSTKADQLTLHAHKAQEFYYWIASWSLFLHKPSDLGPEYSDEGYVLPPMEIVYHEIPVDHHTAMPERNGQGRLIREAMSGVVEASREKRATMDDRIERARAIVAANPEDHFLIWHDLEDERRAIQKAIPNATAVYGSQRGNQKSLEDLEAAVSGFANGTVQHLAAKPEMFGAGANFQRHCHSAIFVGIGYKFEAFFQAIHRIYRFLQDKPVVIHIIYAESEKHVLASLLKKWELHKQQSAAMSDIIREYGLSQMALAAELRRSMGSSRHEVKTDNCTLVNNDCVEEVYRLETDSVGLILTSIPFSTQYEYSPSYNDFGHTDGNSHFWQQMDFLIPQLLRILKPGRIAAIHVKDRIVPGGITGLGYQTVYPFHADCITAFTKHGFGYMGMKTIVTDVVRENNQTYRLGWTEQCKDGSKMGVGMPEYLLYFRKTPTDTTNAYCDEPVVKSKKRYTRSRWQIDAHGFMRSSGDRPLMPEDLEQVTHATIFKLFREYSQGQVYSFEHHVGLAEALETCRECGHIHTGSKSCGTCDCKRSGGILPVTFMLLQPQSWHPDVWTDITRMRTLNGAQSAKGKEMHLCPMQYDLANRVIEQMSNPGDTVLDPFAGLMTVPYCAIPLGRKAIGIELNSGYFADGVAYCEMAENQKRAPGLFDLVAEEK